MAKTQSKDPPEDSQESRPVCPAIELFMERAERPDRKTIAESTPTKAGKSRIKRLFLMGTTTTTEAEPQHGGMTWQRAKTKL